MKQAFILPLPKSLSRIDVEEDHLSLVNDLQFWQRTIDLLSQDKVNWNHILNEISMPSHPILRLSTTCGGQTLLHLAVLANRIDSADFLLNLNPHLKYKTNNFGLTPHELSQFLSREKISQFFCPTQPSLFTCQKNVSIPKHKNDQDFEGIEFLAQPLFANVQVLDEVFSQTQKAKKEDKISQERIWMGIYFDEEIRQGSHPKISIRYIDDQVNFGVFAEQKISSCAFVGEYTGVVQERKKREVKNKTYCIRYPTWGSSRRKFIIDAEKQGNFTRFINHSTNPNLGLQSVYWRGMPRMIFLALKEINKDSQLTFDYGSFFWKEKRQTPVIFN